MLPTSQIRAGVEPGHCGVRCRSDNFRISVGSVSLYVHALYNKVAASVFHNGLYLFLLKKYVERLQYRPMNAHD